jgi:outer membrane protein
MRDNLICQTIERDTTDMRALLGAVALSLTLAAAPTFAQQAPAQPAPRPATPPATQKPPAPAPTAPAQPAAQPPAPLKPRFQDGLKYAYVNVQMVAAQSSEGKAAADKIKALQDQKVRELNERNKALQTAQQKLDQGGGVLSDAARGQLQTEIERQQRDIQRFTEDAQQDVTNLTQQVEDDFQRKLMPVIDKVAKEKQVHFVFNSVNSGLVWADQGLDLTAEVIMAFDSGGAKPAAAAPAAPAPAAPAAK